MYVSCFFFQNFRFYGYVAFSKLYLTFHYMSVKFIEIIKIVKCYICIFLFLIRSYMHLQHISPIYF